MKKFLSEDDYYIVKVVAIQVITLLLCPLLFFLIQGAVSEQTIEQPRALTSCWIAQQTPQAILPSEDVFSAFPANKQAFSRLKGNANPRVFVRVTPDNRFYDGRNRTHIYVADRC